MSLNRISEALFLLYRAGVPALLEGVHGIGKTSILYQLHARIAGTLNQSDAHAQLSTLDARNLVGLSKVGPDEFGLWSTSAPNLTLEELIGCPKESPEGTLNYLRSFSFIPPPDHRGGGIWNVDEINLAFPEVSTAIMSIALEGRYLDYVLPNGIYIVTSQNPSAGEYQSRRLNPPVLNRFCWMKVVADAQETLQHFMGKDFHPAITDCIGEHADAVLNPHQQRVEFHVEQVPTSRSWEFVERVMRVATPEEITRVGSIVFTGLLGPTAAAIFGKFANNQGEKSIPVDEILAGYGYDAETYDAEKTTLAAWPTNALRKQVKRLTRNASVRVDIINMALTVLLERLTALAAEIKKQQEAAPEGTKTYAVMTGAQKAAVINMIVFLCDLPPDQSGPAFLQRLDENQVYDYTIAALTMDDDVMHHVVDDYCLLWESLDENVSKSEI